MSGYFGIVAADVLSVLAYPAPFILGDLVLLEHEVPSQISIGGRQAVTIHKFPGGGRIVDAMGADEGAISWRGLLVGPQAAQRARRLDAMRQQGSPQQLSFGDYNFSVVIVHLEYDYQDRGAVIHYRVKSEIVQEPVSFSVQASATNFSVENDLSAGREYLAAGAIMALKYAGAAGISGTSLASSAVAISALATQTGIAATSLGSAFATSQTGVSSLRTQLAATGIGLRNVIDMVSVGALAAPTENPLQSASMLLVATGQAAVLAATVRAGAYINRANANLALTVGLTSQSLIHA